MNFQQIKLTGALFGGDYHDWRLCGAYATEDGIELKFKRTKYNDHQPVQEQMYWFTVIEDEQNYDELEMYDDDLQQYWEDVVETFIIEHLNGIDWSEYENDYCLIDELIRIDDVGELSYEQDCY